MKNRWFFPDFYENSIYDINIENIINLSITTIILDIDDTLVEPHIKHADEKLIQWIKKIQNLKINIIAVSNNTKKRVNDFTSFLNISSIHTALKPSKIRIWRKIKKIEKEPKKIIIIGDQLFTDIFVGKRMKIKTILVKSLTKPKTIRKKIIRKIEEFLLKNWKQNNISNITYT
jgi:HAD superfamily phosphatase (TIGR01668 family)